MFAEASKCASICSPRNFAADFDFFSFILPNAVVHFAVFDFVHHVAIGFFAEGGEYSFCGGFQFFGVMFCLLSGSSEFIWFNLGGVGFVRVAVAVAVAQWR